MAKPFVVSLNVENYKLSFNEQHSPESDDVRAANREKVQAYLSKELNKSQLLFVNKTLSVVRLSRQAQAKLLSFLIHGVCKSQCPSFGNGTIEENFRSYHKAIVNSMLMDWVMGREIYYYLPAANSIDYPDYVEFQKADLTICTKKGWGTIKWI